MSNIFQEEKDLRPKVLDAIKKYNLKQIDVAKEVGVHHSTLSQWLQNKGKISRAAEESIENWLNNIYSNKPIYAGTNLSRFQQLTNRNQNKKLYEDFDSNCGFDNLIPININVELEGIKYKDSLLWNLNEPYLTLENVSHILATDNNLPISFEKEILSQMKRQISFYKKYNKIEGDEILKTIKVDILIGNIEYKDQFEWDINNPENDPEEFARNVCIDLGLGTEFVVPITHSIREQILEYQKAANNERNNYFYGGNYYRQPNKKNVVDTNNYIREIFTENSEWDPEVKHINEEEIKKFEKKEERKNRYAQRKK